MSNEAAYLPSQKAPKLEVRPAPSPPPPPTGYITIRNAAIAINPIDWMIQHRGDFLYTHLTYPAILGTDVAGEVTAVSASSKLKVGDRVLGYSRAAEKNVNDSAQGCFQKYTVLNENLVCKIPEDVSYEAASVIPLGLATAAAALFDKAQLGLLLPPKPDDVERQARLAKTKGKAIIIWGGSTSVGCNAIQLAKAAGYDVFSTSSPRNFDYLKTLGASQVWDYNSATVEQDIASAIGEKEVVGAVSIGQGAAEKCIEVLAKCRNAKNRKHVAMVSFPLRQDAPQTFVTLRTALPFLGAVIKLKARGMTTGVGSGFVDITPTITNGIAEYVFTEYLPLALKAGRGFVPAPEVEVVGHGLERVQDAMDLQRKGVSAKKLVVTL